MTGPGYLGAVEVDVELNIQDVGPRLRRALRRPAERIGEELEREWARSGDGAGSSYANAFRRAFSRGGFSAAVTRSSRSSFDGFTTAAERAAERAKRALEEATRHEQLIQVNADIRQAQQKIAELAAKRGDTTINVDADIAQAEARLRRLAARRDVLSIHVDTDALDAARQRLIGLADESQRARRAIGSLVTTGAKITAVGAAAGGAAAVMGTLAVNTLAVGAAMGQAAGTVALLPAVLGSMASTVGVLVVGFQGMGEALGAVMDEDPEKLAEALEDLTPAARSAVRAFQSLRPQLAAIREATQESLFKGLDDEIRRLDSTLLPTLERGLSRVAEGMNSQFEALLDSLAAGRTRFYLAEIFENTAQAAEILTPAVKDTTRALSTLAGVGSGFMPRLAEATAEAAEKFANFIQRANETGELAGFIKRSIDAMAQLGRIVGNVGSGIGSVFSAASEASGGLLNNLEKLTAKFDEWASSDAGQDTMLSLFESLKTTTDAVMPAIRKFVELVANDLAPVVADLAEALGPSVADAIEKLGEGLSNAGPGLVEFAKGMADLLDEAGPLLPILGELVGIIANSLASALSSAAALLGPLARAFKSLNDSLGGLPAALIAVAAGVGAVKKAMQGNWLKKFSREAKDAGKNARELGGAFTASGNAADRGGKKAKTFGDRVGNAFRGIGRNFKRIPFLGGAAIAFDELFANTSPFTGEEVGGLETVAQSMGRMIDWILGNDIDPVVVKGQAQSVVDAYGEAFAQLPPLVREKMMEVGFAMQDATGATREQTAAFVRTMATEYLAAFQNVNFAFMDFWSRMTLDAQTGTTNVSTAVSGAMTSMNAVMTGGLSLLQLTNRSAWENIYEAASSKSLSASEAVRGAISTARVVMSGGLADMVSTTSSAWSRMQSSTRSGASGVRSAAAGVASGLAAQFGGLPGKFFAVGRDMMAGLRSGIVSMAFSVAASVGNVVGGAIAMARRMAATNSPSRVFMAIGRDMGAGLAIGMQQTQRMVAGAGGGLALAATGGAAGVLDGIPGVHGGTGSVSNRSFSSSRHVTNNFTISTAAQDPRAVAALVKARIDGAAAGVI